MPSVPKWHVSRQTWCQFSRALASKMSMTVPSRIICRQTSLEQLKCKWSAASNIIKPSKKHVNWIRWVWGLPVLPPEAPPGQREVRKPLWKATPASYDATGAPPQSAGGSHSSWTTNFPSWKSDKKGEFSIISTNDTQKFKPIFFSKAEFRTVVRLHCIYRHSLPNRSMSLQCYHCPLCECWHADSWNKPASILFLKQAQRIY